MRNFVRQYWFTFMIKFDFCMFKRQWRKSHIFPMKIRLTKVYLIINNSEQQLKMIWSALEIGLIVKILNCHKDKKTSIMFLSKESLKNILCFDTWDPLRLDQGEAIFISERSNRKIFIKISIKYECYNKELEIFFRILQ